LAHKLPPLRFGYDALEPYIDAETMELHHDKHHSAYVDNLNKALEPYPQLADLTVEALLTRLDEVPEAVRTAVRNNGGGHANHRFLWEILGPRAGGVPKGAIAERPSRAEVFRGLNPSRQRLEIVALPNQDSVLEQVLGAWWKVVDWDVVDERLRDVTS
jgi:superoxide dismutase